MPTNQEIVVGRLLVREGGIGDAHDGMGITYFGQTTGWLETFHFPVPTNAEDATANYLAWMQLTGLDAVCDKDLDLGDDVCDFAINAGVSAGIKALQTALGVTADGAIGPKTKAAIEACDPRTVRCEVLAQDIVHRGGLITGNPNAYAQFAAGWANRDAGKIRLLA
jgi:lysozyme family protein